jgi:hypothetical protein
MSNIRLEQLPDMTPQEVADFPPALLADLVHQLVAMQDRVKAIKTILDAGIDERYSELAADLRTAEGKDTGTARIEDGEFMITANLPKRAKWDQEKLVEILNGMDAESAQHFAKIEYKVDERKFTAAPPGIQTMLSEARTVETGKPSYKIEEMADA